MAEIATERLSLTPFGPGELDELHALFIDPAVRRFLLDDEEVPREWVEAEIESSQMHFDEDGWGLWTIRQHGDPTIIGFTGFRHFFDPPELQLLYGLLPDWWGSGFATEAAAAATGHAFETLGFDVVRAAIDEPNSASGSVLDRLGFGETRRDGETVFFEVARGEWEVRVG